MMQSDDSSQSPHSRPSSSISVGKNPTFIEDNEELLLVDHERQIISPSSPFKQKLTPQIGLPSVKPLILPAPTLKPDIQYDEEKFFQPNVSSTLVRNRQGTVLGRATILKTDHYPSGRAMDLNSHLQGGPNFRRSALRVYGVAQPTVAGLSTILSLLQCQPEKSNTTQSSRGSCVWFSTREEPVIYLSGKPFVLRNASYYKVTIQTFYGIRAKHLEDIEMRLKHDILREVTKWNGLLLVHEETDSGDLIPTWIAADTFNVKTPREIFDDFRDRGYAVQYFRIPISPDQNIEDNYLDEYVKVIKDIDPSTSLIFNCGMGVVRTTFGMIVAQIIRRAQLLAQDNHKDPFPITTNPTKETSTSTPPSVSELRAVELARETQRQNKAMLHLIGILEKTMGYEKGQNIHRSAAIEMLLGRVDIADSLKAAVMGNYHVITSLTSVIENGSSVKSLVDALIDACDAVINLREDILLHRLYSSTRGTIDVDVYRSELCKALYGLERYFFLIAFTAYVNSITTSKTGTTKDFFQIPFSEWLKQRSEIWIMLQNIRRKGESKMYIFGPVSDLSLISVTGNPTLLDHDNFSRDQWSEYFVQKRNGTVLRSGMILKVDLWNREAIEASSVHGAVNFRNIPETAIYALAQPTLSGIRNVIERVGENGARSVLWINLREEPFVYINNIPYVLRQEKLPRRNIKEYVGISERRLEQVEERLIADILREASIHDGKLLLHAETDTADIVPVWEDVSKDNVFTMKQVIERYYPNARFQRVPITAEHPPHYEDISELVQIMLSTDIIHTSIVLNCQMGKGRSTTASVVILLITKWLRSHDPPSTPLHEQISLPKFNESDKSSKHNYQIIHSLLRVVRNGIEAKKTVDAAIDYCGESLNLLDSLDEFRQRAEEEISQEKRSFFIKRGIQALRRYFQLILFQAYLGQTTPDTLVKFDSFESWARKRKEIRTIRKELEEHQQGDLSPLIPIDKIQPGDGIALTDEVLDVVTKRDGRVLAQNTIIKSDFFLGLVRIGLAEKIEGASNFRMVSFQQIRSHVLQEEIIKEEKNIRGPFVCGVGMPSIEGFLRVLDRMDAGNSGSHKIFWTSLREEPVVYVNGKPFVLRIFNKPIKNLEATGIARERVEAMEKSLKMDVIREGKLHDGHILLHDEEAVEVNNNVVDGNRKVISGPSGCFTVVPIWTSIKESDILTPYDVYLLGKSKGYHLDYARVPITDEQSPIPEVFDEILHRVFQGIQENASLVFNCQMGRGRTTTGIVIGMLVTAITKESGREGTGSNSIANSFPDLSGSIIIRDLSENSEAEIYLNGEYRLILQLLSVLKYGRLAKTLTDRSIDLAEHIQNLRRAIYDYKLRVESLEGGTEKYRRSFDLGINYLIRYFYLIAFAEYLLENWSGREDIEKVISFAEWIASRREIGNLLLRRNLDFS